MKNLIALAALVVSSFAAPALAQDTYVALLTSAEENPPTTSSISGMAVLSVVDNGDGTATATVVASTFDVDETITASHIHMGDVGFNGPVICPLTSGTFTNPVVKVCNFTDVQYTALQNSGLYFNTHTVTDPGGAARGQIYFYAPQ